LNSPDIQAKSAAQLSGSITTGVGKMPGFGGKLSPEEITAVAGFVKGLK
jgi:mono/diheme cytochrome c family protein